MRRVPPTRAFLLLCVPAAHALRVGAPAAAAASRSAVRLQAGRGDPGKGNPAAAVVEGASSFITNLMSDSFKRIQNDPDAPIRTKTFSFTATSRTSRRFDGLELASYMSLPVEEYALYDKRLMTRVAADVFELCLPFESGSSELSAVRPTLRVRVTPAADGVLHIGSVGASLFGLPPVDGSTDAAGQPEPPSPADAAAADAAAGRGLTTREFEPGRSNNATAAVSGVELGLRSADLRFNTTLRWKPSARRNATTLSVKSTVSLDVDLPPPFTLVPRLLVQGAANVILGSVVGIVLPQFVTLLEQDFLRWRNGTRDASEPVGELLAPRVTLLGQPTDDDAAASSSAGDGASSVL